MRSVIRVGASAGVLGSLSMYLLARGAGLVAAAGLVALGVVAGLAMAKWLEWLWYGRQFEAGLKAGLFACVPAGLVALGTLVVQGPHDTHELAAASHLGPINVAGLASAFGFGGWLTADLLGVGLGTVVGITFAAGSSLLGAWSKSARTVQRVARAHEAAQALRRGTWGPATSAPVPAFPSSLTAAAAWQGTTSPSALVPTNGANGASAPVTPLPSYSAQTYSTGAPAMSARADTPRPALAQSSTNSPTGDDQLRAAMREALAMWGDDDSGEMPAVSDDDTTLDLEPVEASDQSSPPDEAEVADQPTVRRKRSSKGSQFLNEKRKARKKSDTRDWLC